MRSMMLVLIFATVAVAEFKEVSKPVPVDAVDLKSYWTPADYITDEMKQAHRDCIAKLKDKYGGKDVTVRGKVDRFNTHGPFPVLEMMICSRSNSAVTFQRVFVLLKPQSIGQFMIDKRRNDLQSNVMVITVQGRLDVRDKSEVAGRHVPIVTGAVITNQTPVPTGKFFLSKLTEY